MVRAYYEELLKEFYESGGSEDELYWLMSSVLLRKPEIHGEYRLRERLVDEIAELARGRVLDVGCGMGLLSFRLALKENVEKVVGIDSDPELIDFCIKVRNKISSKPRFIRGNFLDTKFQGTFDTVIFLYTLRHNRYNEFLRKALQLLEPSGNIIIGDIDMDGLRDKIIKFADRRRLKVLRNISLGMIGDRDREEKGRLFLMVLSR